MIERDPTVNSADASEEPAPAEPDAPSFIVGIGASAGGLEALERFFHAVPEDTGFAFVVIQHLSPDFNSLMDELLARFTRMSIVRVSDPITPRRNTIYLLRPRKEMVLHNGQLLTFDKPSDERLSMPINTFFRSMARDAGDKAIAIVLSGTGTDGSLGLCDVHEAGGLVLAQSLDTAKFDGMPRSAMATGQVDTVLAPDDMPAALLAYAKNPAAPLSLLSSPNTNSQLSGIPAIIERLREVYGLDFNYYKPATISRRIDRRVTLGHAVSIEAYCANVLKDPEELDSLYKDLLIGVTRFFRDPEAFAILENTLIPKIIEQVPPQEEIRVWVAGCATGEEPYSLAILLIEALEARNREPKFKIFASDMHRKSLQIAADGLYLEDSLAELTEERRNRFFERDSGGLRVTAQLRRHILFSHHNLIRDPPFTRIDLVSCRNVLIYLQSVAQVKALASFHFALKVHGYLFLGPSEGIGELQNEFDVVDRQWKLFSKSRDSRLPIDLRVDLVSPPGRPLLRGATPGELRTSKIYEAILKRYVPSAVLVDSRREIVHVFGDADRFLRLPMGRISTDLVAMTRGDLRVAVSSALQTALKRGERVAFRDVRFDDHGTNLLLCVTADPILDTISNTHYVLVVFEAQKADIEPSPAAGVPSGFSIDDETRARLQQLEVELMQAKESLQTTIEELETSNEELQASNEELQASNEELQSTNEELHSVNEELYSVNAEHEQRIRDLNRVSGDLKNLIQATEIGTIFLDSELKIRFFTPATAKLFNLITQDIERDIRHITSKIKDDDVFEDIIKVASTRIAIEKRVQTNEGETYLRRVMPYFDVNRAPSGVVLTFVDITALSRAEEQRRKLNTDLEARIQELKELNEKLTAQRDTLDQSERFLRTLTDNLPGMVGYWDKDLICRFANQHYVDWFGIRPEKLLGMHIRDMLGPELFAKNEPFIKKALGGEHQRFERDMVKANGELRHVQAHYIPDLINGEVRGFVVLVSDISERKRNEEAVRRLNHELELKVSELRQSEERFRLIFENALDAILTVDASGAIHLINPKVESLFGYSSQELIGKPLETLVPDSFRYQHEQYRLKYFSSPTPRTMGQAGLLLGRRKDGSEFPIEVGLSPLVFREQTQVMAFISDMTLPKQLEAERDEVLRKVSEAQKLESLWVLAGGIAHDFNNLLTGVMASAGILANHASFDREAREAVGIILESSRRASELCQQLLAYSGRSRFVFRTQDLSEMVRATAKLVRASSVGTGIELCFDLATDLPPVLMDSTQIRQVIMNLVINAAEAIVTHSGRIVIRTGAVNATPELLQNAIIADEQLSPRCVFLEVADNGSGIRAEDLKRIFEPFYSTKFTGRGLGLSAVLGIVRGHHGALLVQSMMGKGTTFTVLLPPAQNAVISPPELTLKSESEWRGMGTVLVADDEESIRYVIKRVLSDIGFRVELAANGREALERFQRGDTKFTLILLDLTMPGMTGAEAFSEIRKLNPGQKVLLMSGFSPEEAHAMIGANIPNAFLAKPFDIDTLLLAVRETVESDIVDAHFPALPTGSSVS